MKALALLAGLALAGCTTTSILPVDDSLTHISYETGPCFGACPVYRMTVFRGVSRFNGIRDTAQLGAHGFPVTPAEFEAFARHLEPVRPKEPEVRYSGERCENMATDLPSVEVKWMSGQKVLQSLYFNYGCDMEKNQAMAERLERAPDLLPVRDFIKAR